MSRATASAAIATVGLLFIAAGCGGDDSAPTSTLVTTTRATTPDTSPIFTENTDLSTSAPGTSPGVQTTTSVAGATTAPTSTVASATPTTIAAGQTTTTTTTAGGTTTTTVAPAGNANFVVTTGSGLIDGTTEQTVEVRARPGASGDVSVPVNKVLEILIPGPGDWDFDVDPDEDAFDYIDFDTVPDGADDPFPESGGATIITLRPLKAGATTLMVIDYDTTGAAITIRVTAT